MKRLGKILVTPVDAKSDTFIDALCEYFTKEFKLNNIENVHNHKSFVSVDLSNKYQDKYDAVIIDCMDGKIYLRGKGVKDHKFGRLSRFLPESNRKSDAYNCINWSGTRTVNRIKKLEEIIRTNNRQFTDNELEQVIEDNIIEAKIKRLKRVKEPICQMPDYGFEVNN